MPRVVKLPVRKPGCLARGYYFSLVRPWTTAEGISYNYLLFNRHGRQLELHPRGRRSLLAVSLPKKTGGTKLVMVHRLFAFNSGRGRCNPANLCWSWRHHVHHKPHPRHCPWKNCKWQNMAVVTEAQHRRWHGEALNSDVTHLFVTP